MQMNLVEISKAARKRNTRRTLISKVTKSRKKLYKT
jgi:hypothetical protein